MKTLMISAPCSNTGKTMLTLGIIRALGNRGMDVAAFKTGPDYIDSSYQALASCKPAGNLDMHLMGRDGVLESLARRDSEFGIIEGAMGYFDGTYNTYINSSFDIARTIDTDTIIVYRPQGEMFSVIPKLMGMVQFSKNRITGVILNKTTEKIYKMLKPQIEHYVGIDVLGYLPEEEHLKIGSRHLGLMRPFEVENIEKIVNEAAELSEKFIDLDKLVSKMRDIKKTDYEKAEFLDIDIAVAKDEAFGFSYSENIDIYSEYGRVNYFSPLKDRELPKADVVIIGGGYPELYVEGLEENGYMRKSVREYAEAGGYMLAYGGGLLYMGDSLDGYRMAGVFNGYGRMTPKLQHFGYNQMMIEEDCPLGSEGTILAGREFHKSTFDTEMKPFLTVRKPEKNEEWRDGYRYKNAIGFFSHFNAIGWKSALDTLFRSAAEKRSES